MSENSNKTGDADSSKIKTKKVVAVLLVIGLVVLGFYLYKFHHGFSNVNGDWGTFGDYVGGILNPVIAGFAFYLIAKTYELQKIELEATRSLLEVSTNAQKEQIKLAALTAHLNSVLMRIDILKSERLSLLQGVPIEPKKEDGSSALPRVNNPIVDSHKKQLEVFENMMAKNLSFLNFDKGTPEGQRFIKIEKDITELTEKSVALEKQIESFYNEKI